MGAVLYSDMLPAGSPVTIGVGNPVTRHPRLVAVNSSDSAAEVTVMLHRAAGGTVEVASAVPVPAAPRVDLLDGTEVPTLETGDELIVTASGGGVQLTATA